MKKAVAIALVAVTMVTGVFAFGAKKPKKAKAPKKVVLRWGSVHADGAIITQMMKRICANVNAKTQTLELQAFPNGALGGSRDVVEGVQSGIVDMATEGPAQFASQIPIASLVEAPYLYRDVDHLDKALKGMLGQMFNTELEKIGVHLLGGFYYGARQLTTNKEVKTPSDVAGMKIRVPEVDTYVTMIDSWGAKATPLSFNELYLALQQKIVDGQENPLPTFDSAKFYEVQKYVIMTNHIICSNMIFINKAAYDKLSDSDKKILNDCVAEGIAWNNAEVQKSEKALVDSLKTKGVTVVTPDEDAFRTATVPVLLSKFDKKWGAGLFEKVQNIK